MIHELISQPWLFWIFIAAVSAIIEVAAPSFSFIFIAFAGLIAAVAALFSDWPVQAVTFALALVLSILFLRPKFIEKFHNGKKMHSRSDILVGQEGIVTESIDPKSNVGRVLVCGQDWAAQSNREIAVGKNILVHGSDGIILNVREK